MENEVMNYEDAMDAEIDVIETQNEGSGVSALLITAIITGVAAAGVAAYKLGKKVWDKHKAKKELRLVDEHDFVEPSDEQINEVTQK